MAKKTKKTELKDVRIPIMMSESEVEAIDDWSFKNRIRSRSEAIRRLCQIGLAGDATSSIFGRNQAALEQWFDKIGAQKDAENGEIIVYKENYIELMTLCVDVIASSRELIMAVSASRQIADTTVFIEKLPEYLGLLKDALEEQEKPFFPNPEPKEGDA